MKLVLVRPPFYALFGLTIPKMKVYPLNLLSLATYVRDVGGHAVAVVDGENITVPELERDASGKTDPELIMHEGIPRMVALLEDDQHPFWSEMERAILAESPDLVGISCNSGHLDTARLLVRRLQSRNLPVVLGGPHPTVLPEQSLIYSGADFAVVGEGEVPLVGLMDALAATRAMEDVPSLVRRDAGGIRENARGELLLSVDTLPIPDRSFIDRSQYFGDALLTGRGCPFDCAYCASRTIWGKRVRLRSVDSIIRELERIRDEVGPGFRATGRDSIRESAGIAPSDGQSRHVVKILDDTFTVNRKRTLDLLDAIVAHGLNCFEFTGGVRVDTLDEDVVRGLKAANVRRVTLGLESGSPRMLKSIRKGATNEDAARALKLLRSEGISSHAFFMIGLPDETPEDIELSKRLIEDIQPDHVEINMVTPYPGTDLFSRLIGEDPLKIDRWYRWFHQGMSTHSHRLGYDLDRAYQEFLDFARDYHRKRSTRAVGSEG
jgi:anaerobic magnesium-protoporphyrin IX monomethyl ester cyclase